MEKKLIKKMMIASILLFTIMNACAQQVNRQEYTIVPIDSIYLENKGNRLTLNNITSKNIQTLLGKPTNTTIYVEKWSDEYDKQTIYKYELLTIYFKSLENEEWLDYIECSNPNISVIIGEVHLFVGGKDTVLNIFKKSWKIYQELENTEDTEKTFIIEFPIKEGDYEYLGLIFIGIKNGNIAKIEFFLQDEP